MSGHSPYFAFVVNVRVPDAIDADTWAEIMADADTHDVTDDNKIGRWLGGFLSTAGNDLAGDLPEGWSVIVSGV